MINLNLIPEKLKREIELKKLLRFINKVIVILTVVLLCYFLGLSAGKYILQKHYAETKSSYRLENKNAESDIDNVDIINKKINFIYDIQKDNVIWSKLIYDISLADNDGVIIESLSMDKDKNILNIRGEAKSREKLLEFKDDLEKISYLDNIVFPLQSLLKKEDISFDINATIKSYEFRTK